MVHDALTRFRGGSCFVKRCVSDLLHIPQSGDRSSESELGVGGTGISWHANSQ